MCSPSIKNPLFHLSTAHLSTFSSARGGRRTPSRLKPLCFSVANSSFPMHFLFHKLTYKGRISGPQTSGKIRRCSHRKNFSRAVCKVNLYPHRLILKPLRLRAFAGNLLCISSFSKSVKSVESVSKNFFPFLITKKPL